MKECARCHIKKDESQFHKGKNADGLHSYCKKCIREKGIEYRRKNGIRPIQKQTIEDLPKFKVCTKCNKKKYKNEFKIRSKDRKDNKYYYLNPTCRSCDAKLASQYYQSKKDDPVFKEKNRQRAKRYSESNVNEIKQRRKLPEYLKKHANWENKRYHRIKDQVSAKMKIKRQTPEYKEKMRIYRIKNKDKIHEQEMITKKRYHEKNRDAISDVYVISQLGQVGIKNPTPEQIDIKRAQILLFRIKSKIRNK